MNIYFGGSIAGGRKKQDFCKELIRHCKKYGTVYNQCVGKRNVAVHSKHDIYECNMKRIDQCDVFIAEVTIPSLGLGMEIEHAIRTKPAIPVLCLFDMMMTKPISKMLTDCSDVVLVGYTDLKNAKCMIDQFMNLFFGNEANQNDQSNDSERDEEDVEDEEDTIIGHPNCHYGDCYHCHVISCAIYQELEPIPTRSERDNLR